VVGFVCQVAVRKLFPAGPDVREVTAFVTGMRSRIHSTTPPEKHVCKALILDALGDHDVDLTNLAEDLVLLLQLPDLLACRGELR
jgi:hypothetical protein